MTNSRIRQIIREEYEEEASGLSVRIDRERRIRAEIENIIKTFTDSQIDRETIDKIMWDCISDRFKRSLRYRK